MVIRRLQADTRENKKKAQTNKIDQYRVGLDKDNKIVSALNNWFNSHKSDVLYIELKDRDQLNRYLVTDAFAFQKTNMNEQVIWICEYSADPLSNNLGLDYSIDNDTNIVNVVAKSGDKLYIDKDKISIKKTFNNKIKIKNAAEVNIVAEYKKQA